MKLIREITDLDILGSNERSLSDPKISARAVLYDANGYVALMHVKKKQAYTIPGGGVENKESLVEAMKREILEETGCDCEVVAEIGYVSENRAQHDFTQISYYYLAKVIGRKGSPHLTLSEMKNENEVVWVTSEEMKNLLVSQEPINYQFAFIKERDISVLNHIAAADRRELEAAARRLFG